jgi:hypothetical protein
MWTSIGGVVLAGVLAAPIWAVPPRTPAPSANAGSAQPGAINYVEGQVSVNNQALDRNAIGSAMLQPGQAIVTQNGRAEVLLTPGVFFRMGNNSSAQMISPDLANTEIRLDRGRAIVEVDWIQKENRIRVDVGATPVLIETKGLYDFDADHNQVRVFDGRLAVLEGNGEKHVQGGHEMTLNSAKLKAVGFDKKAYEDDLYRWSKLRSSYVAEANIDMARTYYGGAGLYGYPYGYAYAPSPWYGPGWYWDPWFTAYTWLPGDGIFWNPWGFGFYSPLFVGRAPFIGFHAFRTFGPAYRPAIAPVGSLAGHGFVGGSAARPAFSGGFHGNAVGGFRSGGFAGGGFHGGGRR